MLQNPMPLPLWPDGLPDTAPAEGPTLTLYPAPPETATGAAVVVCPGGGYQHLADHEGAPVARWLNTLGITGLLLHYRLGPRHRHPAMLHDAARAVRTARAHSQEWGIDPARVGILGFSAGGHLASTLATHFDAGSPNVADPVERVSSRPDLAVLVYPVISLHGPYAHSGSRENLLGPAPAADLLMLLSNALHVTPETPPCFLVHTADDASVPAENSLLFALALRAVGVPVELHLYASGPHGFGLAPDDPVLGTWPARCADWLRGRGFLAR